MHSADYNQILKEYFDITDTKTRKIMLAINEADQNAVLSSLTAKLYEHIVDKVGAYKPGSARDEYIHRFSSAKDSRYLP